MTLEGSQHCIFSNENERASIASSSMSGILVTELGLGTSSVFEDHAILFIILNIHKIDSIAH